MATLSGGQALQTKLNDLAKNLTKKSQVNVGFLEGATYPDGTPVAMVAAIQNDGAPSQGIPPRPFFSDMIRDKSPEWGGDLAKVLQSNGFDADNGLEIMGTVIAGQLQESIIDVTSPALSILTLMARKAKMQGRTITGSVLGELANERRKGPPDLSGVSTKPEIDTGHMLASVDHEVK